MDPATSFGRPLSIRIDRTRPYVEVDISDGSLRTDQPPEIPVAEEVNVSGRSPPPKRAPFPPQSTHTCLDFPISSTKAIRVGCWPSSPIDSDAFLKGKLCFNILQALEPPHTVSIRSDIKELRAQAISIYLARARAGAGPGPFITSGVKCSDVTNEDIETVSKLIEREKKPGDGIRYRSNNRTMIVAALKKNLKEYELRFKSQYSYDTMEYRHCITPNNSFSWKQESSEIMWAGVYGIDDMCVVTLSGQHVDGRHLHGSLPSFDTEYLLNLFRRCVLSELEDLADPPCKFSEEFDGCFDPPFCIVPEMSSFDNAPPEEAVSFVQQSGLLEQAKDSGGAIKLAISAFQRLLRKKFEAKEIEVTVLVGRKFGAGYTRDLKIHEIGDYLAAVEAFGS